MAEQKWDSHACCSTTKLKKSIFIVEDDPFIAEELAIVIGGFGYEVLGIAHSEVEAEKFISQTTPDLVCLDIDLGSGGSGFTVASQLQVKKIPLLFITSYVDEVTFSAARNYQPLAYIVKPYKDVDIKINLALAFHQAKSAPQDPATNPEDLFARKDGEIVRVDPDSIQYLKGDDNYTHIFLDNGEKLLASSTLKKMDDKLQGYGFIRIHKSFIVPIKGISGLSGNTVFVREKPFPIGKSYKQQLMSKITIL